MIVPMTPLEFKERAISLFGSKVGIVDGDKRFTYREYGQRVNRLANALTALGVRDDEVVSFITYNTHQLLEGYFAVPQIKSVVNPINIRLSHQEIEFILNHAETAVLCFHHDFLPLIDSIRANLTKVRHFIIMEYDDRLDWAYDYEELLSSAAPDAEVDLDAIDENAVVELFYTSGTMGVPKGVTITNRNLYLHSLMAIPAFNVTDADTLLHVVPLFHVNGWGSPQVLTAVGGRHVIVRKIDFGEVLRLIETEKVTKLPGVPTIYNGLFQHPDFGKYDLSSLDVCFVGGSPASPALIEEIERKIGCRAIVGYGLTETTPTLTMSWPKSHLATDDTTRRKVQATTGLPVVGIRLRVVDEEGQDVPRDGKSIGEIITRSNTVMLGYLKDPLGSAASIVDGWFHTGDMAVMDEEGYVTIVDRKKDIIISGGEIISSVEVEKALATHNAVYESIVIGVPDEKWGEVSTALVVLKPGMQISEEELTKHVRDHLASYKVPKSIVFLDKLPKSGTGKILKRQLREPYWEGMEKRVH